MVTFAQLRTALHWSRMMSRPLPPRARWWHCPTVIAHVNRTICGKPLDQLGAAAPELIRQRFPSRIFRRGISVGCGIGFKEMILLEAELVETFDLYELSSVRIEHGRRLAQERGLSSRVRFHHLDGMTVEDPNAFDLVHWNGSLHHMMNADKAVRWSRDILKPGGVFYMDEFVGPDRMQWRPQTLRYANRIRRLLSERPVRRAHPLMVRLVDPTECANSSRILPAIRKWFPEAEIIPTGGVIYAVALQDVLQHIPSDSDLLVRLLWIDDQCTRLGEYVRAVAIALKS